MSIYGTDEHAIDLFQLQMIAGNPLPARLPDDTITQIVLNRKAVEYLESTPEDIIGKRIEFSSQSAYVCGVVENFHFKSLHTPIGAFGFLNEKYTRTRLWARISSHDIPGQLKTYENLFKKHYPNDVFDVYYPELEINSAYRETKTTGNISFTFSILAILIACMGVFGLTAFMAEQRTKEIGIRKVMGAGAWDIVSLFTHSYTKLLGISLVIAIPVAWWAGARYLQDFAYRISLSWWMFAAAALITIVLTLLTVCALSIKAATENPVNAIKSE
jgi:putative ABC transport system permease protein